MREVIQKQLYKIIVVTIFAILITYFYLAAEQIFFLSQFRIMPALGLLISTLIFYIIQGEILRQSLLPFEVSLKFVEWFGILILTLCANYALPFSGIGFRVAYLKTKHGLSYAHFTGSLATICILEILVFCAGGIIGIGMIDHSSSSTSQYVSIALYLGLLASILVIALGSILLKFEFPGKDRMRFALEGLSIAKQNKLILFKLLLLTIAEFIVCSFIFYFGFESFSLPTSIEVSVLCASLTDISFFFRFAPGALGTYDAAVVYAAAISNLTIPQGLGVAFLTRLASVTWFLTIGPIAFLALVKPNEIRSTDK